MTTVSPSLSSNQFFAASAINFTINFLRMPELSFVVQEANFPDVTSNPTIQKMGGIDIHRQSDKLHFQPLTVKFIIDEGFRAHKELFNWLSGSSGGWDRSQKSAQFIESQENYIFPDYDQRKNYAKASMTTGSLILVNANKVPTIKVVFVDLMIVALGGIHFDIKKNPLQPITASATFTYDYYEILDIKI